MTNHSSVLSLPKSNLEYSNPTSHQELICYLRTVITLVVHLCAGHGTTTYLRIFIECSSSSVLACLLFLCFPVKNLTGAGGGVIETPKGPSIKHHALTG